MCAATSAGTSRPSSLGSRADDGRNGPTLQVVQQPDGAIAQPIARRADPQALQPASSPSLHKVRRARMAPPGAARRDLVSRSERPVSARATAAALSDPHRLVILQNDRFDATGSITVCPLAASSLDDEAFLELQVKDWMDEGFEEADSLVLSKDRSPQGESRVA